MVLLEDFISGFALGQVTMFVIDGLSLLIGILAGLAWLAGGQGYLGTKLWRRLGVPFLICVPFSLTGHILGAVISFCLQVGVQSLGYGEVTVDQLGNVTDQGSWLGQRFGKHTRLVWYGLLLIAMCPLFL